MKSTIPYRRSPFTVLTWYREFFAGNFAGISSLIKVRWPMPFFFATFFFGGIEKKKVACQTYRTCLTFTLEKVNKVIPCNSERPECISYNKFGDRVNMALQDNRPV
jgi:hypothetical protein